MKTIELLLLLTVSMGVRVGWGVNTDLVTNLYNQVSLIYENEWPNPEVAFTTIRAGGVDMDLDWEAFEPVCLTVSNHYAEINSDWRTYETNEMVRFTTLSALCHSGYTIYTNTIDNILTGYEADTNFCSWATIRFLSHPYGTSSRLNLGWSYDWPNVSNLVLRLRAAADAHGDTNRVNACDAILSGVMKQGCLDSIELGEWSPPVEQHQQGN